MYHAKIAHEDVPVLSLLLLFNVIIFLTCSQRQRSSQMMKVGVKCAVNTWCYIKHH